MMNKLLKVSAVLAVLSACLSAQNPNVSSTAKVQQMFYSGSNLQYICEAPAVVASTSVAVSDTSLTSFTVTSNVGTLTTAADHNLWIGAEVRILAPTTAGVSGTYYIRTVPTTKTYTVATSGVVDGTYTANNVVVTTNAPLLTSSVWFVTVLSYNGSVLQSTYPGGGSLSVAYRGKCSDRATY